VEQLKVAMNKYYARVLGGLLGLLCVLTPQPAVQAASGSGAVKILVLGDSLSAEYGLPRGTGWVKVMEKTLTQQKHSVSILNASISGETTSGAVSRVDLLLKQQSPKIVVIELGGNDALRGLPIAKTEENLIALITRSQQAGAKVVLVGIRIPPNYGRSYTEAFAGLYPNLAKKYATGLVPFVFAGLEDTPDYFQADRIHPTVKSQPIIAGNITPVVNKLLTVK
jgi:acyl-CoA thioesterase I